MSFIYRCEKCNAQCTKPPVKDNNGGLGKWRCPTHGPNVKVIRSRP